MGQSVVDLPDPLEHAVPQPLTSSAPAGVDDLLAQMAGDEIDRLLAEADAPRDTSPDLLLQKNDLMADGAVPTLSPPEAVVVESSAVPVLEKPVVDMSAPVPGVEVGASGVDIESAMTGAERSALDLPHEQATVASEPEATVFDEEEGDTPDELDESLPFYLKPLEWLNAPLEALPEGAREVVGKIALLTFFNAAAVLIYVLVFRKHR